MNNGHQVIEYFIHNNEFVFYKDDCDRCNKINEKINYK